MIYIACPEKFATGGTELLHQLANKLNKMNVDAYIFYYNFTDTGNPIHERFEKYNIKYVTTIEDIKKNILIVPEIKTDLIKNYTNIKKTIWWLSIDNYLKQVGKQQTLYKTIKSTIKALLNGNYFQYKVDFSDDTILHLYQSYYAEDFLTKKGVKNLGYLSDYIGDNFFKEDVQFVSAVRDDVVLYNPKKGYNFTKKIMDVDPTIKFVPLQNMTQSDIASLCKSSKIYIDFGNHPGKDRFPREAATLGCIVITGKRGSANNDKDIIIPTEFKFADENANIVKIVEKIKKSFDNYDEYIKSFEQYRQFIAREEELFEEDVKKIYNQFLKEYAK